MVTTNLIVNISAHTSVTTAQVGDIVAVNVRLDTGTTVINVVEGHLAINGSYEVVALNTAKSVFSLWPNNPSLENGTINFTGGIPNGIKGSDLNVFTVYLKPKSSGDIHFDPSGSVAYLNDGQGTKINLLAKNSDLAVVAKSTVQQNALISAIEADKTPPQIVLVELGSDRSTFDGKNFLTIIATDTGSGINRYEVKEGDLPMVRTGQTYILQNQKLGNETIEVRVTDNAGNVSTFLYQEKIGYSNFWFITLLVVGIIVIIVALFKMFKKRK